MIARSRGTTIPRSSERLDANDTGGAGGTATGEDSFGGSAGGGASGDGGDSGGGGTLPGGGASPGGGSLPGGDASPGGGASIGEPADSLTSASTFDGSEDDLLSTGGGAYGIVSAGGAGAGGYTGLSPTG